MAKHISDNFLTNLIENKSPVTVFLINGVKLQGLISFEDETTLLLKRDGHTQLIFKHAVSTVMPTTAVDFEKKE